MRAVYTEEILFSDFPLVVEGTLVTKGQGVARWEGWVMPYDRYELTVTHVWSGDEGTKKIVLAFPTSRENVIIDDAVRVDPRKKYMFFLSPEPTTGMWEGMQDIMDTQVVWEVEADRITPTAPNLRAMNRSEFGTFIATQIERRKQAQVGGNR